MNLAFAAMTLSALTVVQAQAQTIVEACQRVAVFEFGITNLQASDVQAFPELTPPRVRMRVSGEGPSHGVVSDALANVLAEALGQSKPYDNALAQRDYGLVRCEFESNDPPFRLTAFECAGMQCFISPSRLEELRLLLHRELAVDGEPLLPIRQTEQQRPTGMRLAVARCWNVGALGTDARQVEVTVAMDLSRDGTPSNLRLVAHSGGSAAAAEQAYETARRAILRCAPFDLPQNSYDEWRQMEMTFNPAEMGMR